MRYWQKYFILILIISLWIGFHVYQQWQLKIPPALENQTLLIRGEIVEAPIVKKNSVKFILATREYGQVQLDWYRNAPLLQKGQIWDLHVRLKNPRNYQNPGGFDYERFLFVNRITATGYVYDRAGTQLVYAREPSNKIGIREKIALQIDDALATRSQASLIKGLAVGIRDTMTDAQWQLLQKTGTSHLLAISGLHIGLVSGFAFFLMKKCWSLFPYLPLYCPAPLIGAIAAMLSAFIYAALAGFAIPTQRALIMIMVFMICLCTRYPFKNSQVLCLAAFFVVLYDPFALMSASFWLSFMAVGFLFYIGLQQAPKWQHYIRVQWFISLGLMPLVIAYFQQISWVSPISNLIAIPYASFFVVPFTLIGVFASFIDLRIAAFFWLLAESALNYLQWFLEFISQPSWAWQAYSLGDWRAWLAMIMGIGLLFIPGKIPGKLLGLILLLAMTLMRHPKPEMGEVWLTVLDVGQGLAVLVQTREHVLLYDAAVRYDEFDLGEAVILPFLRHQGIQEIDTLVLSHDNLDHTGGAQFIMNHLTVKHLVSGEPITGLNIVDRCIAGDAWVWDQVRFEFLYPYQQNHVNHNDNSCVLKITTGKHSALLTGDIEKTGEQWLVQHKGERLKTNILLAPHHGSKTSSTIPFVALTDPDHVIFSTGYLNRYKFPREEVVKRYRGKTYNTAKEGAISFRFNPYQILRNHMH